MALTGIRAPRIEAITTCVPARCFDNVEDTTRFSKTEVRKVVALAGVAQRRLAGDTISSGDLCVAAAKRAIASANWELDSIDGLVLVTQTPDYLLPSTSCVIHKRLGLSDRCAAFDVGLGCSGYPYGLWLAAMMLQGGGARRVLLLHGETPSRFVHESDRSVSLLFGDAGSATALGSNPDEGAPDWFFALHSDGRGYEDMIIEAGGFRERFCEDDRKYCLRMNGANIFNFSINRVPALIEETLEISGTRIEDIDYFIFHQSNQFIMSHIAKKMGIAGEKMPLVLKSFGNTGGPSIPLTMTGGGLRRPAEKPLRMMLLGYGVGLSWGSALISFDPGSRLDHMELEA